MDLGFLIFDCELVSVPQENTGVTEKHWGTGMNGLGMGMGGGDRLGVFSYR